MPELLTTTTAALRLGTLEYRVRRTIDQPGLVEHVRRVGNKCVRVFPAELLPEIAARLGIEYRAAAV